MKLLSKPEYLEMLDETRDKRMAWWRDARFGMFVHYGLYSALGRNEWAMSLENWPLEEYKKLASRFLYKSGAAETWADLALKAGMKYMVLTTRHHDGFSLWDSQVNPYNSVNFGPKVDIVAQFVEACRKRNLRIGFYSSLMDWSHPDGGSAAYDSAARKRFLDYIYALNEELLTKYGQIDVLWYDVPCPMENHEGWNSLEMNQRLRAIQPNIIINDRCNLPEDFGTPEEHLGGDGKRDWESCMTFNGISWGYVDSAQAEPYSYNAQRIVKMLATASSMGGNLLLNIGPTPDGSVPIEAIEPLKTVGRWLEKYGECAYGKLDRSPHRFAHGVCTISFKGRTVYLWNWIWPDEGEIVVGGFKGKLKAARMVGSGKPIQFEQDGWRIFLKNLNESDPIMGVAVIALEFDEDFEHIPCSGSPALNNGRVL